MLKSSITIIFLLTILITLSPAKIDFEYLIKIDIDLLSNQDILLTEFPGEVLRKNTESVFLLLNEASLTNLPSNLSQYDILDKSDKNPHYIYIYDPKNKGPEPLEDYGNIVYKNYLSSEFILKSPVKCESFLNNMGYSAYELKPIITELQYTQLEEPQFSNLIKTVIERISKTSNTKMLEHLSNTIPTRYSFSPEIDNARDFIHKLCQSWGYDIDIQDYIFDIVSSDYIQGIYFLQDRSHGWVPTRSGFIFHTDDLCYNFDYSHSRMRNTNAFFLNEQKGWLSGLNGLIAITSDGGDIWTCIDTNHPTSDLWDIEFVDENTGFACGQDGVFIKTTDGGYTWENINLGSADSLEEMDFVDEQTAYLAGYNSTIYKTNDGWETWQILSTPVSSDFMDICFVNEQDGWACGVRDGSIIHTSDGGLTWEIQNNHTENLMNIDFWDETTGWAVSWDGTVLHTEDGGLTWEVQETGTLNPFYSIVSLDENSAIAGGLGCLYLTRDDGDTWESSDFGGAGNLVWKNLIATKTGDTKPDEIVIAIAHFDSISEIPWERAPGADDNASGTTALLAMAEVLKNISTKRTVKFIFASGEEQGLRGSRAYAEWARENNLNIIAVLNMDMIAYLDDEIHDLQIRKNSFSEWLSDYIIRVEELYNIGLTLYPSEQGSGGSDHIPFWEQGYSALCSIEYPGDHWYPYYHTTEDLIEHLFMDYQAEVTQLNLATLLSLAEIKGLKDFYQKENPFTYPNPFRASMPAQGITFTNLSGYDTLKIYTISGKKIIEKDIKGEISYIWDLTTQDGEITSSGVYLWVLEGEQNDFSGKLAIIR